MLVFVDESGCPGFLPDVHADSVFVLAMVVFTSRADAAETQQVISDLQRTLTHKFEFKFAKCSFDVRDAFFRAIAHCKFFVVAIVVNRRRPVLSQTRMLDCDSHLSLVEELLTFDVLRDVELKIDGPRDRRFSQGLRRALAVKLRGRVRRMRMADSARDHLIQLADMCAGAVARAYRDRPEANRWFRMLGPKIREIRELK
jgi:hypothetical protein